MQMFETTDRKVVTRCRYAHYRGLKVTLRVEGMVVTGLVRSVQEVKSSDPVRWIIALVIAKRGVAA
jgi:hypothetical protein